MAIFNNFNMLKTVKLKKHKLNIKKSYGQYSLDVVDI